MAKDRYFQMRADDEFLSIIDEWRRVQPDIPPRAEAIRRLVMRGIFESREVQIEYSRILYDLHREGRLTEAEWKRVQDAITRHAADLAARTPALKASFERLMGWSQPDDQTG